MMSEKNIHAICKICPGEFTGCDMDKPDCWIVQGSFALDQVKALEAERDTFKKQLDKCYEIRDSLAKGWGNQCKKTEVAESRLAEAEKHFRGCVDEFENIRDTSNSLEETLERFEEWYTKWSTLRGEAEK